jgi:xanthine/uracil/vitamin C permease (AzgA family)
MENIPKMIGVFAGAIFFILVLIFALYMELSIYMDTSLFPEERGTYFIADTVMIFGTEGVAIVCGLVAGFVTYVLLKLVIKNEKDYKNSK